MDSIQRSFCIAVAVLHRAVTKCTEINNAVQHLCTAHYTFWFGTFSSSHFLSHIKLVYKKVNYLFDPISVGSLTQLSYCLFTLWSNCWWSPLYLLWFEGGFTSYLQPLICESKQRVIKQIYNPYKFKLTRQPKHIIGWITRKRFHLQPVTIDAVTPLRHRSRPALKTYRET